MSHLAGCTLRITLWRMAFRLLHARGSQRPLPFEIMFSGLPPVQQLASLRPPRPTPTPSNGRTHTHTQHVPTHKGTTPSRAHASVHTPLPVHLTSAFVAVGAGQHQIHRVQLPHRHLNDDRERNLQQNIWALNALSWLGVSPVPVQMW